MPPVDDTILRLQVLARVMVPFVFFMCSIYLLLHLLVARLARDPASPVLWFFQVVTGPLTRPIRALLPQGTPEGRVRLVTLGACLALWIASRILLRGGS